MKATWANIIKARELLKWQPKMTIEKGLENTIAWFKDNLVWARKVKL